MSTAATSSVTVRRGLLTSRGRAVGIVGIMLVTIGLSIDQRSLARIGILLVLLPLLAMVVVAWLRPRVHITRDPVAIRMPLGSQTCDVVTVERRGGLPLGAAQFTDTIPSSLGQPQWSAATIQTPLIPTTRGRFAIGPVVMRTVDPFGMACRHSNLGHVAEVVVTPRIVDLGASDELGSPGFDTRLSATDAGRRGADDAMVRDWHTGDSVRRIHWRSTAHRGELMVRREEQAWNPSVVMVLDSRAQRHAGTGPDASFEWAVSAVASIATRLTSAGYTTQVCDSAGLLEGDLLDSLIDEPLRPETTLTKAVKSCQGIDGPAIAILGRLETADIDPLMDLRRDRVAGLALVLDPDTFTARRFRGPLKQADEHTHAVAQLADAGWTVVPVKSHTAIDSAWQNLLQTARMATL
ncbi:DUF58 domain-containing protein [Cutibacterium sp. WCA-380-WT-3A]|uniref:DUF58 domain-containing protein n=1 Tax=Cutibacterium porci TaxID=2605781 RepID=A0A7K0J7D6_9ACTN|nr:DUF58 domain-containing protein [Cutibacterium porci]MSS45839.1 DUF58 domain-containing protein [Cutibacterium porci]